VVEGYCLGAVVSGEDAGLYGMYGLGFVLVLPWPSELLIWILISSGIALDRNKEGSRSYNRRSVRPSAANADCSLLHDLGWSTTNPI
jgi:hypothetical protein